MNKEGMLVITLVLIIILLGLFISVLNQERKIRNLEFENRFYSPIIPQMNKVTDKSEYNNKLEWWNNSFDNKEYQDCFIFSNKNLTRILISCSNNKVYEGREINDSL